MNIGFWYTTIIICLMCFYYIMIMVRICKIDDEIRECKKGMLNVDVYNDHMKMYYEAGKNAKDEGKDGLLCRDCCYFESDECKFPLTNGTYESCDWSAFSKESIRNKFIAHSNGTIEPIYKVEYIEQKIRNEAIDEFANRLITHMEGDYGTVYSKEILEEHIRTNARILKEQIHD